MPWAYFSTRGSNFLSFESKMIASKKAQITQEATPIIALGKDGRKREVIKKSANPNKIAIAQMPGDLMYFFIILRWR